MWLPEFHVWKSGGSWGMWLQLYHRLPSLNFFYVLYVESCHLQSWQVLSLLFHAFWHWNGWIIVNFFLTKFLFCWFQSLIDPFFTSFFPLSLCASLDMAHRGVLRCVSPAQFPFLFLFSLLRSNDVVYTCDTPLLLSKHSWLCRLLPPSPRLVALHRWVPGQQNVPALCSHTCCISISFSCVAFCRFAPLCYTGLSLKLLGLKVVFFLSGQVLCLEQSSGGHRTELVSHRPLSEPRCEESLHVHDGCCGLVDAYWPSSGIAIVTLKTLSWSIRVAKPLVCGSFAFLAGVQVIGLSFVLVKETHCLRAMLCHQKVCTFL